ncbi:MAG: hypothetical protein H0X26_03850 [Alphaproteobacteria bacterium]|nr:hypothetical protein [Alphaproteobacteria bacterium]
MSIVDEERLLSTEEQKAYQLLLELHGYEPYQFLVEVTEDQRPIDMNDINYVIILKIKVTHLGTDRSKTYISKLGSRTWVYEFEDDLLHENYTDR